jgi:hypothetical protein
MRDEGPSAANSMTVSAPSTSVAAKPTVKPLDISAQLLQELHAKYKLPA